MTDLPASFAGDLGPFGMAEVALRLLHSLVELQPAQGEGGRMLHPLPSVHRLLAGPTCLPHITQVSRPGNIPLRLSGFPLTGPGLPNDH